MNVIALLLLAAIGAIVGLRRRSSNSPGSPALPSSRRPPAYGLPPRPPTPAKRFAYIYQQPNEIAVRMAIGTSPREAREMGIFGSPAMAAKVAADQGATLAWQGVRELP
jgi:hypothetical protein